VKRNHTPFFWRCRIVVGNETRWVVIESLPRELLLTSTKPGGSGLGLYMVRMVMENHAGTLSMREAHGGGAAAVLTFPRITRST
jgi:K+-sensing histidine kinase KdpD